MDGNITKGFALLLVGVFLFSSIGTYELINYFGDKGAQDQVYAKCMDPVSVEDVNVGQARLKAQLGFMDMNLQQLAEFYGSVDWNIDQYAYESWKLPSLFYDEREGDCEDFVLFALAVLDHSIYDLEPQVGQWLGEGHAWLIVNDTYVLDTAGLRLWNDVKDDYVVFFSYSDMLEGSLFFGLLGRTATWDGGSSSALASNATNWDTDVAPVAGDTIVFNTGSKACTWDIAATFAGFYMNASYTGVITQAADFSVSVIGLNAGTFTGSASYLLTCHGDFIRVSTTITNYKLRLLMDGSGVTFQCTSSLLNFINTGTVTIRNYIRLDGNSAAAEVFNNTGTIYINHYADGTESSSTSKCYIYHASASFKNTGTIYDSGQFYIGFRLAKTIQLGNFYSNIVLALANDASANRIITMGSNSYLSSLSLKSVGSTYSITLDMASYDIKTGNLLLDAKSTLKNTGATYSWLHCKGYFLNYTDGIGLLTSKIYLSVGDWSPRLLNSAPSCGTNGSAYTWTPSYNETLSGTPTFAGLAWLSFAGGVVSGTPNVAGLQQCWLNGTSQNGTLTLYYTWIINVTEASSGGSYNGGAAFIGAIDYSTEVLVNYSVSYTLNVTGNVTALVLPSWLSLSNNGTNSTPWILSGQPLYVGSYTVSLMSNSSLGVSYLNYTVSVVESAVTDYNPMWIWLVFLFALTIINYVGYRRLPLLALMCMIATVLVAITSVNAFGDLWMIPFVMVLVNVVIAVLALTRR